MKVDLHGDVTIHTMAEFLAHALTMETEAAERYGELADQMETHRKTAVATIFRRLEAAEREHLIDLNQVCDRVQLPHIAPWEFKWRNQEGPETIDISKVHYQLSVRGAILLALEHERNGVEFYANVAQTSSCADVQRLALQYAQAEREHVVWLETCLAECGPDDLNACEDPDPPLCQE